METGRNIRTKSVTSDIVLTLTCDNLTRRHSCPCSEHHSAQYCCCSPILEPGSKDLHWSVDNMVKDLLVKEEILINETLLKVLWEEVVVFLTNLQDIVARFHICDVNPLAVDVCVVGIITSWAQALRVGQHPYKTKYKQTFTCKKTKQYLISTCFSRHYIKRTFLV